MMVLVHTSHTTRLYPQPQGESPGSGNTVPAFPGTNAAQGRPPMSSPSSLPGGGGGGGGVHGSHYTQHHTQPQHSGNPKATPYFPEKPLCRISVPSGSAGPGVNGLLCNGSIPPKDDGSSGYGSPDSEIVDAGQAQ